MTFNRCILRWFNENLPWITAPLDSYLHEIYQRTIIFQTSALRQLPLNSTPPPPSQHEKLFLKQLPLKILLFWQLPRSISPTGELPPDSFTIKSTLEQLLNRVSCWVILGLGFPLGRKPQKGPSNV